MQNLLILCSNKGFLEDLKQSIKLIYRAWYSLNINNTEIIIAFWFIH